MAAARQPWVVIFAGGALAAVLSILFLDRPAARFAHDAFHAAPPFVALTHLVDPILPLSALGFLLIGGGLLLDWHPPPLGRLLFCLCVTVLLAIMVKDQLKYAFGRTWPETWTNNNPSWIHDGVAVFVPFHGGAGWSSFPSGHMTSITTPVAVLMSVARPMWRAVLVLPVALVAIGLFGADYHFVGDMIAGIVLGSVCAAIGVRVLLTPFDATVTEEAAALATAAPGPVRPSFAPDQPAGHLRSAPPERDQR